MAFCWYFWCLKNASWVLESPWILYFEFATNPGLYNYGWGSCRVCLCRVVEQSVCYGGAGPEAAAWQQTYVTSTLHFTYLFLNHSLVASCHLRADVKQTMLQWFGLWPGARFTKYLTTILRLSYNWLATIHSERLSKNTGLFLDTIHSQNVTLFEKVFIN